MEVIRIGEFNPDALEQIMDIQPFEAVFYVANSKRNNFACLKRLDYLLEFIDTNYQEKLLKYVENLANKFQEQLKEDFLEDKKSILADISKETKHLSKYRLYLIILSSRSFQ